MREKYIHYLESCCLSPTALSWFRADTRSMKTVVGDVSGFWGIIRNNVRLSMHVDPLRSGLFECALHVWKFTVIYDNTMEIPSVSRSSFAGRELKLPRLFAKPTRKVSRILDRPRDSIKKEPEILACTALINFYMVLLHSVIDILQKLNLGQPCR